MTPLEQDLANRVAALEYQFARLLKLLSKGQQERFAQGDGETTEGGSPDVDL